MPTFHRTLKLLGNGIPLLIDLPVVAVVAGLLSPCEKHSSRVRSSHSRCRG